MTDYFDELDPSRDPLPPETGRAATVEPYTADRDYRVWVEGDYGPEPRVARAPSALAAESTVRAANPGRKVYGAVIAR